MEMLSEVAGFVLGPVRFLGVYILVLSVLVAIHELGHYLAARACGVRIETFSIGFGREIYGFHDRRGTRWKVSIIPLGGYVKMFGDIDPGIQREIIESQRRALEKQNERNLARGKPVQTRDFPEVRTLSAEERAVSFFHKPLKQRAFVVAAGPLANFALAAVVFAGLFYHYGEKWSLPVIAAVQEGTAAERGGLQAGDRVASVNGIAIDRFEEFRNIIVLSSGDPLEVQVVRGEYLVASGTAPGGQERRGGRIVDLTVTPEIRTQTDRFGNSMSHGFLGVEAVGPRWRDHSGATALWTGIAHTWQQSGMFLTSLGQIVTQERSVKELGGPVRVATLSNQAADGGWLELIVFIAQLSIGLALINLLPIPVLDGGYLFIYAIEALRGAPLNYKVLEHSFRFGIALVLSFMVLVMVNDLRVLKFGELLKSIVLS